MMARAAIYKGKKGSGVTINGVELTNGGVVTVPRSLVDHLLAKKGWAELGEIEATEEQPKESK